MTLLLLVLRNKYFVSSLIKMNVWIVFEVQVCREDVAFFTTSLIMSTLENNISCTCDSVVVSDDDRLSMAVRKGSPFKHLINIGWVLPTIFVLVW